MRGRQYLTKTAQYGLVYSKGSAWTGNLLVMKALPNGLDLTRFGLSVGRRVGGAVVRNRVKRLLREIMRQVPLKAGWDIILIARPPAATASYNELKERLTGLLLRARLVAEKNENTCPAAN